MGLMSLVVYAWDQEGDPQEAWAYAHLVASCDLWCSYDEPNKARTRFTTVVSGQRVCEIN